MSGSLLDDLEARRKVNEERYTLDVSQAIEAANALQAGPYVTTKSYQFMADIAAVGHHGRGFKRVQFIFDTTGATPRIVHRQDLTHLGWALGRQARETLLMARNNSR